MGNNMKADSGGNFGNTTKWLTFLVYFLLTVLTFMSGWQQVQVSKLDVKFDNVPKEYVSKERYLSDRAAVAEQLKRIDAKLDRLIERTNPWMGLEK